MGKHFLWDPVEDNIVKEIDDSGTAIADYTTEPYLYGDLISQHRDGQSSFYHYDGQGSTTSLTDSAGNVTDTYAYAAFGDVTDHTGSRVTPFQYIGQKGYYRNLDLSDVMVRRRLYEPCTSRFTTVDPVIRSIELQHPYAYVSNRSTMMTDPSGLVPKGDGFGLEQRVIEPQLEGKCGELKAHTRWRFALRNEEKKGLNGWVLQIVHVRFGVIDCKERPITKKDWDYIEAFEVKDGEVYAGKQIMPPGSDYLHIPDQGNTEGSYTASFAVVFVKDYVLEIPPWSKSDCPQSRGLPCIPLDKSLITVVQKKALAGISLANSLNRDLTVDWNCCTDPKKEAEIIAPHRWEDRYYDEC